MSHIPGWTWRRGTTRTSKSVICTGLPRCTQPSICANKEHQDERIDLLDSLSHADLLTDFCLQVEGVDWSVVSGVVGSELIVCVRNVGFVQKAGAVLKAAFGDLGPAGGHRSMAKAILPLEGLPQAKGGAVGAKTYRALEDRFLAALKTS